MNKREILFLVTKSGFSLVKGNAIIIKIVVHLVFAFLQTESKLNSTKLFFSQIQDENTTRQIRALALKIKFCFLFEISILLIESNFSFLMFQMKELKLCNKILRFVTF